MLGSLGINRASLQVPEGANAGDVCGEQDMYQRHERLYRGLLGGVGRVAHDKTVRAARWIRKIAVMREVRLQRRQVALL